MKITRNYTYDKVKTDIRKLEQKSLDDIADKLASVLNALIDGNMQRYRQKVEALIIENSGWEQKVALSSEELESQLSTLAENCKGKLQEKVLQTAMRAH